MKRVLITGINSYVGNSFKNWLDKHPDSYLIDFISLRNDSWKREDFSKYDVIFHVAGIAHIKESKKNEALYYRVNRDLAHQIALKAKKEGVQQYIFLSSMSVYGINKGIIGKNSKLKPISMYGKSKQQAEELIKPLNSKKFKVAIIRPPMIYGKGCKGNFPKLETLSLKLPFFPNIKNQRSMIYIDNFCEFIKLVIDKQAEGLFFPQNKEYICTSELVKLIADSNGKKISMTRLFNPLLNLLKTNTLNKVFGNLVYEKEMSQHNLDYQVYDLRSSIFLSRRET